MRDFATLLDRLSLTASRNAKLVLVRDYLAKAPDPDRGWALAALTGELGFDAAKPAMIRKAVEARMDEQLFRWSYDYVGDLAETVALVWPARPGANREPELSEVVDALRTATRGETQELVEGWLDALEPDGRWALLKLLNRRPAGGAVGAAGQAGRRRHGGRLWPYGRTVRDRGGLARAETAPMPNCSPGWRRGRNGRPPRPPAASGR